MTKNTSILLRRIFGTVLSISIFAAGAAFICACLSIYYAGNGYSADAVKNAFSAFSYPIIICLILSVIGFIMELILPADTKANKAKTIKNYTLIISRLASKKDFENGDTESVKKILRERKRRKLLTVIQIVILAVCVCAFCAYLPFADLYQKESVLTTDQVIRAMYFLLPCLGISFIYSVFCAYSCTASMKKESELMKELPVSAVKAEEAEAKNSNTKETVLTVVKIAVAVIAVVAIIFGAIFGGYADVFAKAVNICTECIGLG